MAAFPVSFAAKMAASPVSFAAWKAAPHAAVAQERDPPEIACHGLRGRGLNFLMTSQSAAG